jgi:protein-S-isoprenylcysteine O-methyltransferase Ste14
MRNEYLSLSPTLPESCTSMPINMAGLLGFFISLYLMHYFDVDPFHGAILAIVFLSVPIIILELTFLKTYRRASTGLDFSTSPPRDLKRSVVKLIGLYGTIGWVALFYWIFPEYQDPFYKPYWQFAYYLLPIVLIGGIPYTIILDRHRDLPKDGYWHMGMLLLGQWNIVEKKIIGQHLLEWLVKTFFLAVMFSYLVGNIYFIKENSLINSLSGFPKFYDYMYNLIFSVDLAFVSAGYLLTLRIFDSHMRSVEPTLLGWMVALKCYRPFSEFSYAHYTNYDDGYYWYNWLSTNDVIYVIYGLVILFLLVVYVYATITFGIRFSNLTHRGILTNGPYRFMKHPAYLSKNLAWWLIVIPFISTAGFWDAMKHSILLLIVNVIYFLRARTEERHLSRDPVYVQYASAMNKRSICRVFSHIFPFLRYDPAKYALRDIPL